MLFCHKRQREERHFFSWRRCLRRRAGHLHVFIVLCMAVGVARSFVSINHVGRMNTGCAFAILPPMKIEEHPMIALVAFLTLLDNVD